LSDVHKMCISFVFLIVVNACFITVPRGVVLGYRKNKSQLYDTVNCKWVDTQWQYYRTHLQTKNT
jgi:hypothetical protein